MASKLTVILAVSGLLVFGALNTLTTKIQFTMESVGSQGEEKLFKKPFFAVLTMFLGMSMVLIVQFVMEAMEGKNKKTVQFMDSSPGGVAKPLLNDGPQGQTVSEFWGAMYVGIPATLDLVATALMYSGLLFISASIWQMLRGSMIVFSALISGPLLGRKLKAFHWIGVLICVFGIVCVGMSNYLNTQGSDDSAADPSAASSADAVFGMGVVLLAQVVQAMQVVVEEKLLKDVSLPVMKIVGYEGVWGVAVWFVVVMPVCLLIPGSDNGHLEDSWDSVVLLQNNPHLLALVLLYIFSCATYNCSGMAVTQSLSAVHRTMLEATRTAVIWAVDLGVYYILDIKHGFSEAWLPYSYLQLIGFVIVLFGQMVYSQTVKVPGLHYTPAATNMQNFESPKAFLSGSPGLPAADNVKNGNTESIEY